MSSSFILYSIKATQYMSHQDVLLRYFSGKVDAVHSDVVLTNVVCVYCL